MVVEFETLVWWCETGFDGKESQDDSISWLLELIPSNHILRYDHILNLYFYDLLYFIDKRFAVHTDITQYFIKMQTHVSSSLTAPKAWSIFRIKSFVLKIIICVYIIAL